jgi:hypothetical protein
MVTIDVVTGCPGLVRLRFEVKIYVTSLSEAIQAKIISFSEFEFGSDDDSAENIVYPSGFELEFVPGDASFKAVKKMLNLLKRYVTDVNVYRAIDEKEETLFFSGTVDRNNVQNKLSNRTVKIRVDDYLQGHKDKKIDNNPYGFVVEGDPTYTHFYPAQYISRALASKNFVNSYYATLVTDSAVAVRFTVSGNHYYATLGGLYNATLGSTLAEKYAYIGFHNNFFIAGVDALSPKRLSEVLKHIANSFGCVVVPGYEGKVFFQQRWRNVSKTPVMLKLEDILEDSDVAIIMPKDTMKLVPYKNFRRLSTTGIPPTVAENKLYTIKDTENEVELGYVVGEKSEYEEVIFYYKAPFAVTKTAGTTTTIDSHAGFMAIYPDAAHASPPDIRYWNAVNIDAETFELVGETGTTYDSMLDIYSAKVWQQLKNPRLNYVLTVHGTHYNLEDYYTIPIDETGNTTVYRCRKIAYDFSKNTTKLDLVEFIEDYTLDTEGYPAEEIETGVESVEVRNENLEDQIDGSNRTFYPAYAYESGTLQVYLNGVRLKIDVDYEETSSTQFDFATAPETTDYLTIDYKRI